MRAYEGCLGSFQVVVLAAQDLGEPDEVLNSDGPYWRWMLWLVKERVILSPPELIFVGDKTPEHMTCFCQIGKIDCLDEEENVENDFVAETREIAAMHDFLWLLLQSWWLHNTRWSTVCTPARFTVLLPVASSGRG